MKKMIVILALVAVACAPAMAAVNVCYEKSGTTVTVKYNIASGPNSVRAFAVDANVSTGTISNVTCSSTSYYIYPGSIQIVNGSVANSGDCVCSSTYPGTNAGEGTSAVTVEMGSLYTGTNKPASSGTLFTMTISNSAAVVGLKANVVRGGVVMENPAESPGLTIGPCVTDCYPSGKSDYSQWCSVGKPSTWCYTKQCHGDATGSDEQYGRGNYVSVGAQDVTILLAGYNKSGYTNPVTHPWIAADFNHSSEQYGRGNYVRVGSLDVTILLQYYNDNTSTVPANCLNVP